MRLARRTFLASTVASLAAPAVLRLARADTAQFAFKLQHSFSSVSGAHDKFLAPWARQVEAQSGGRIRIDLFPSMQLGGAPAQLFDQARDGIAEIVWAAPSTTPGRFPKTELFELPFVPSRRALVSSKAIDDYARANLVDEFREVHPICFSCADRSLVHSNRPVHTLEDMTGLRLHVQTRFAGQAIHALDAIAVPMPNTQLPLAVTQHVVDGCVDPWNIVPALKLGDLLKAHTDFSDYSLSSQTHVLAMNKAAYDRLPRDLKAVVDANSGEVAAGMAGTMWDLQAAAAADVVSQRGDIVTTLLPEAVAHWRKATEPVIDMWLKDMKEHKVDGAKLLASARVFLAKYENEPEPQGPQPAQPSQPQAPSEAKADVNPTPKVDAPAAAPAKPAVPSPAAKPAPAQVPTASVVPSPPAPAKPLSAPVQAAPAPAPVAHPAPATAAVTPAAPPTPAPAPVAPTPAPLHAPPVAAAAPPPPVVKPVPPPPPKTLDIPL